MTEPATVDQGYFSHYHYLGAALVVSRVRWPDLPILELGVGWGSTPLIHHSAFGRDVVSVDTQPDWLRMFAPVYQSERHRFIRVHENDPMTHDGITGWEEGWARFSLIDECKWGVAFVDCWPGEVRVPLIRRLKGYAKIIVAHDCEADEPPGGGNYRWRDLEGRFRTKLTMKRVRPWTTIYSDEEGLGIEGEVECALS